MRQDLLTRPNDPPCPRAGTVAEDSPGFKQFYELIVPFTRFGKKP